MCGSIEPKWLRHHIGCCICNLEITFSIEIDSMKHLYYVFSLQIGFSAMTLYAMNCQDRDTKEKICLDLQQFCENAKETVFEKAKVY